MFRRTALLSLLLLTSFIFRADVTNSPPPPDSPKHPITETLHGVTLTDPYRWLEDQNAPETRKWIDEQNAYTHSLIDKLPGRDAIAARMSELLKVDVVGVPFERNKKLFFTARKADQDQSVLYMRDLAGGNSKNTLLVDGNALSPDHTVSASFAGLSKDARLMAYNIRRGGADETEVHFKNLQTLQDLGEVMPTARYGGISFLLDNSGFYYSIQLKEGPRLRFHKMGTDFAQDQEIYGKGLTPTHFVFAQVTEDGKYLLMQVVFGSSGDKGELYVQDLANHGPLKPIVNEIPARFSAILGGDVAYTETNWNAPNGKILAIDLAHPEQSNWKTVIPEAPDAIEAFDAAGGKLVVEYLHNAASQLKLFGADGKPQREIKLPGIGTVGGLSGRWETKDIYYRYVSFNTPPTVYQYDLSGNAQQEFARTKVPVDPNNFEVKQVWYGSKDSTKIPMFLVYKKGLKLDGNNPVLLTGYGGFNVSRTPEFSVQALYWAERGGVFALPNLRGGGEFGEKWHHAGMLEKKQNVFDDFIGAAEWLVANKYTNPQKLAITGGSNGGLLVGAALTQRPELFRAVICSFPLLDMIRYQNFLVARFWTPEYGSSEDAEQFKYILKYSPYQNVKSGTKYPAVMLWSGDFDTRVAPLHARKMTALLQADNGGPNPIMLHYDVKSGHSEGRPVTKIVEDQVDQFSFLFWQLGVAPPSASAGTAAGNH
jgi:prolyl oligopeptidase